MDPKENTNQLSKKTIATKKSRFVSLLFCSCCDRYLCLTTKFTSKKDQAPIKATLKHIPELVTIPVEPWQVFLLNLWRVPTWEPWPGKTVIRKEATSHEQLVDYHLKSFNFEGPQIMVMVFFNSISKSTHPSWWISKFPHVFVHTYPTSPSRPPRLMLDPNLWCGQGGQLL